jgi:NTE family protein
MGAKELETLFLATDWGKFLTLDLWSGVRRGGYCAGDALLELLLDKTQGKTFKDLQVELKVVAADLVTNSEVILSRETTPDMPVGLAARASASIPFVFVPVTYKDWLLVDGGCCDNIPADHLIADEVPRVGIQLTEPAARLDAGSYSVLDMAGRVLDLVLASSEAGRALAAQRNQAHIVEVPTSYASSLDTKMTFATRQRLLADGYRLSAKLLKTL